VKLSQLKIDPEFQSKIPPLQFEEEQQLEQNIIAEGRLLNPIITWNGYILDGQNTVEARRTCNGGKDVTIRCKVFYGLTKEDEATLFAIQTGNATCLTAGERLRANLVAENPDALYFVGITSNAVWNLPMTASGHPGKSTASKQHTNSTSSTAGSAILRC
jgi:hypothetical protein